MQDVENPARDTLSKWADKRVILDYWFSEICQFTEFDFQGREKTGQGIITHLRDDMFAFQFMEGARLELQIRGEVIVESVNWSPDAFELQVRTPDHGTWILLKPSKAASESIFESRAA